MANKCRMQRALPNRQGMRDEEDMNRTAELRTSQVSTDRVSEGTHKKISELEDAIAALRAENSIRTKQETWLCKNRLRVLRNGNRKEVAAEELHRTRRNRKDEIGKVMKERPKNDRTANVVR